MSIVCIIGWALTALVFSAMSILCYKGRRRKPEVDWDFELERGRLMKRQKEYRLKWGLDK